MLFSLKYRQQNDNRFIFKLFKAMQQLNNGTIEFTKENKLEI